jgi:hypothetical protein
MKIIKIITFSLVIAFVSIIGYANFRYVSPAEKLGKVQLASFMLAGNMSTEEKLSLEKNISATQGITACSLGEEGNIASVIFFPEKISIASLKNLLSNNGKMSVSQKHLSTTGSCPVHKVNASLDRFVSALDFRKLLNLN